MYPSSSLGWADFFYMMECTPESVFCDPNYVRLGRNVCTLSSIRCMGGHSKHKLQAILENLYRQSKKLGKSHLRNYKALGRFWAVPKQQQLSCKEGYLTLK